MATMTISPFTKSGAKSTTTLKLDGHVFGVTVENHDLLKLAYTAYLSNGRDNLAITKTRGLVRGGGRKPHKQKGTGRARAGSIRSPIWRGGGIVFGPTGEENYTKKLQQSAKRLAVRQALSLAFSEGRIQVIDSFESKDGKTSQARALLDKLGVQGSVLLVVDQKDVLVERAIRNLLQVKSVSAKYLNVFDVMNADTLIFSKVALEQTQDWLRGKK